MNKNWGSDNLLIGQMARMHNISPKMLRYWDRIDVLKPAVTNEINGYRYYTTRQFHTLNFIVYMRSMGLSYKEIKNYLKNDHHNSLIELLDSQIDISEKRIKELQTTQIMLKGLKSEIENALDVKQDEAVRLERRKARQIIRMKGEIKTRVEFEKLVYSLRNKIENKPHILMPKVGLFLDREEFKNGNFEVFSGIYILKENYNTSPGLIASLPAGDYASITFWGRTEESENQFAKLVDFLDRNNLQMKDDVIRCVVAPGMHEDERGHLAQIAVRVSD